MTVILSGLIFGLLHLPFSVLYASCTGMMGFVLAFGYVFYTKKYSSTRALWLIAGIHAFNNISHFVIHWFYPDL
jgi:membrane protease YdiL (CAAX protease family)